MHPPEVGGLGSLVAVVGLGHGVSDGLDDGEVGADLRLGLALELASGEVVGEPGVSDPGELDGQAEEGDHEGPLRWEGGERLWSPVAGVEYLGWRGLRPAGATGGASSPGHGAAGTPCTSRDSQPRDSET